MIKNFIGDDDPLSDEETPPNSSDRPSADILGISDAVPEAEAAGWTLHHHDMNVDHLYYGKRKASEEEEEGGAPPELVKGVGEEAYSVGTAKFGALYVLKGNKILRISVGGAHSQPERIEKMKSLAQYAVGRL